MKFEYRLWVGCACCVKDYRFRKLIDHKCLTNNFRKRSKAWTVHAYIIIQDFRLNLSLIYLKNRSIFCTTVFKMPGNTEMINFWTICESHDLVSRS